MNGVPVCCAYAKKKIRRQFVAEWCRCTKCRRYALAREQLLCKIWLWYLKSAAAAAVKPAVPPRQCSSQMAHMQYLSNGKTRDFFFYDALSCTHNRAQNDCDSEEPINAMRFCCCCITFVGGCGSGRSRCHRLECLHWECN